MRVENYYKDDRELHNREKYVRLRVDLYKFGLLPASLAFALLMLIVIITTSLIPQVYGFNFDNHQICKGWTQEKAPIVANKFELTDQTVYFYFKISWANMDEFEQTWENFRISLIDPSGAEAKTFTTIIVYNAAVIQATPMYHYFASLNESAFVTSAFFEVLNITSATKNGKWKLNWYNGSTLLFREEFVVGEEQAGQQTPLDILGPLIAVIIAIIIALVAIIIYLSRRKKKIPETLETPSPPLPTL